MLRHGPPEEGPAGEAGDAAVVDVIGGLVLDKLDDILKENYLRIVILKDLWYCIISILWIKSLSRKIPQLDNQILIIVEPAFQLKLTSIFIWAGYFQTWNVKIYLLRFEI